MLCRHVRQVVKRVCHLPDILICRILSSSSARNGSFEDKIHQQLKYKCLIQAGDRVLLNVSGGCDSMAMLHVFAAIHSRWQPQLVIEVIHFNHQMRPEAAEEEQFVTSEVQNYNMPLHIRHLDKAISQQNNFQATARSWRQVECLNILNRKESSPYPSSLLPGEEGVEQTCQAVAATAHHLDDQVETSLLKLVRGTHLSHLHPMLPISLHFIRPMLCVTKKEILRYMEQGHFEWREDASNMDSTYKRNAIRHDLVPVMTGLAGSEEALYRRIEEIGTQSIQLKNWLCDEVKLFKSQHARSVRYVSKAWCDIPTGDAFQALPHMVQSAYLRSVIDQFTGDISEEAISLTFEGLESILQLVKGDTAQHSNKNISSFSLSKCWLASRVGSVLRIQHSSNLKRKKSSLLENKKYMMRQLISCETDSFVSVGFSPELINVDIGLARGTCSPEQEERGGPEGGQWHLQPEGTTIVLHSIPENASLDIRSRVDGDVFCPANYHKPGPVKLSSFLQDNKIPLHIRDHLPLITLAGEIIAVPPHYVDGRYMMVPERGKREEGKQKESDPLEIERRRKAERGCVMSHQQAREQQREEGMSLISVSLKITPIEHFLF